MVECSVQTHRLPSLTFVTCLIETPVTSAVILEITDEIPIWQSAFETSYTIVWRGNRCTGVFPPGVHGIGFATPEPVQETDIRLREEYPVISRLHPIVRREWLKAIDRRLTWAERLSTVKTLTEASIVLEAIGGLEKLQILTQQLERDYKTLQMQEHVPPEFTYRFGQVCLDPTLFFRLAGK